MRISQHNQQLVSERSSSSLGYEAQTFGDTEGVQSNPLLRPLRLSVLVPVYNEREVVEESLRRVLSLEHFLISSLEVIVVDDRSTDGTWPILQRLASEDDRIVLLRNERNLGKGGALRTAIAHATGDVAIPHDADLECDPTDIPSLLLPFAKERADAVYGSRYLPGNSYRRVLSTRHTAVNRVLTSLTNWLTDFNVSDMETCYKAVRLDLLKSIPLRSNDFRFEVEITFKLAKRKAKMFEVPVHYSPRSRGEGKKMSAKDGILALVCMLRFWLTDDYYIKDQCGSPALAKSESQATI
jgi:glycosyltransferase involved in cell wall biosynthesis